MGAYRSQQELETIMSDLWTRILGTPEIVSAVSETPLIARFRYTDYPTTLVIDTRAVPPAFYWNPVPAPEADVEMILSSETGHLFWMEQLNVPLAIATRKIIPKGSVQKALKLIPALKPAFALYPDVLAAQQRQDLLRSPATGRKKRRSWFRRRRSRRMALDTLPVVPLPVEGGEPATGREPAGTTPTPSLSDLFETMVTIREFERHLSTAFRNGALPTEAIHLSIGQEAVAACVCRQLRDTDYLNTTHRGHGHIIAKGADLNRMMAEIYGRANGLCAGKGGSMHVTDGRRGILGANGIVGAGYLLAMGAGMSIRYRRTDDISVVIAGDGSVNQGMFHEAMNMIGVFQLPVLVVIENNRYGEFTAVERHSAEPEIHRRAAAYGISSVRLDGNDVNAMFDPLRELIGDMRKDGRPRLVELMTYRWHGHMEGEPEAYRTDAEKRQYMDQDPVEALAASLVKTGAVDPDAVTGIRQAATDAVNKAAAAATSAPEPDPDTLTHHVYAPEPRDRFEGAIPEPTAVDAQRQISMAAAVNEALADAMAQDPSVFLWGEDVSLGGYFNVTEGLVDTYGPERIIDTPISENGIIGGAVGAAMTGMRPVAEILFGDFLSCCMDPILNQAAKLRYMTGGQVTVPLTIRTPVGSGIGMAAQHSQSMEKFFFGIPGLLVVAPSDGYTAKGLLAGAIRSDNPVLFFEHKLLYAETGPVPDTPYTLPMGKARIVRPGRDVTLVTHLLGVGLCRDAAAILAAEGIEAEIIDLCTLYPLDTATILDSIGRTRRLVTVEEGVLTGGIGAEVIARVATAAMTTLQSPPLRIGAPECPIPYAKNLENAMLPTPETIIDAVRRLLH